MRPIPTSQPQVAATPPDPAVAAVCALVSAASAPMAVFDADGRCVVANAAFLALAADPAAPPAEEHRVAFSPDGGGRAWTLASIDAAARQPGTASLNDVVVNALPVMFNAKDAQGRYLFMNRYQAELYGIAPNQALGRTATDLLGPEYGRHTGAIDQRVLRTGQPVAFYEQTYAGVDGQPRHWLTSKVPLGGGDAGNGGAWGVATVAIDITERKQLEARLRDAKEQAEEGSRAKSRFLAAMSHELRTPLNAVIGFADMMTEEAHGPLGAPEYLEYSRLILSSGLALLDLITKLLDHARAEAGSLELHVGDVEVIRLLRSAAAGALEEAATGTAPLPTLAVTPEHGMLAARADEQRLRQVLRALIGNALKFTPPGGRITVSARALPRDGVEVSVVDSGIGMSAAELAQVFDPFWQADSRLGRARQGAGIGLKLARQIMALHGGTLRLESEAGQGTRAILTLPGAAQSVGSSGSSTPS